MNLVTENGVDNRVVILGENYCVHYHSHAGLEVCQPSIREANARYLPYHEATHSSVATVDLHAVYANA
jgi:hypothetical protein